jgi:hypothetical protein
MVDSQDSRDQRCAKRRHMQTNAARDVCAEQLTTRAAQYIDEPLR